MIGRTGTPSGALQAQRRVVLLGASNLTKGIGTVLDTARHVWGGPQQVFATLGHGRSYGRVSRVVGVQLPGIESCRLWDDLRAAPPLPTAALVTDIGNDLIYEEPVHRIVDWVARCLDRLVALDARITVTLLPIESLKTLGTSRFHLFRTLFFPFSRITLSEVTSRAFALNDAVRELAQQRGCRTVGHQRIWYGFDPIHIRFQHRRTAWREIIGTWQDEQLAHMRPSSAIARTVYLRTRTPAERRLFWLQQRGRTPSATFADGTTVAVY